MNKIKEETLMNIINALNEKIESIKDRIELYNDCYEGTPDECIREIKEIIGD